MKRYLLLFSLSLASLLSSSQSEKFDLSKYKLPDIKRQQLDFNFESKGRNTFGLITYGNDSLKNKANSFNGYSNIGYSFYRNSENIQARLYGSFSSSFNKTKNTGNGIYNENNSDLEGWVSISSDVKYFFDRRNWFLTTSPYFYLSYSDNNNFKTGYELEYLSSNASFKIGGGKGRIEEVQDFRQAFLLLNELEKRNVLTRNISENEIIELSSLMSKLKNERFFDSRKRKEADLVALDSFLTEKGFVNERTIRYFTGLEDIWTYGGLQLRESGRQVLFSVIPEYNASKIFSEAEDNITENVSVHYNLYYTSKKPVSLMWQTEYSLGIDFNSIKRLEKLYEGFSDKSYKSNFYVNGKVGFYPNTRTDFNLSGFLNLNNQSEERILDKEYYSAQYQISTEGYYYISEKLRLGYTVQYNSRISGIFNSDSKNLKYNWFYYGVNLNYAIF